MPDVRTRHTMKSQMGFQNNSASVYEQGGGDISFATGMLIFQRMPFYVPQGATINSALLTWNLIVKNQGTTQNTSARIRAHASGDSPILRRGQSEWSGNPRPETSAYVDWTVSWNGAASGDQYNTVNVAPILQELVNRSDWTPGSYVTFITWIMNENGSDMSVRANNDFVDYPRLDATYTEAVSDRRWTVNRCENSDMSADILPILGVGETGTVPYWWQGDYFGGHVGGANQGLIERDTTFTRIPGVPTMRFTCGPPEVPDANKWTGPNYGIRWETAVPFIFCGWIYISTAIPTSSQVAARDPYWGHTTHTIVDRGKWVPFCTHPLTSGAPGEWNNRWPAIAVKNFQQGWQFWVSEPAFIASSFRQMPFNGGTPDVKDPGGVTLVDHIAGSSRQQASRVWTPRTAVVRNGTVKRAARYIKRTDGLLQLAESIKGGPLVTNLPAVRIDSYPAGKTISEL